MKTNSNYCGLSLFIGPSGPITVDTQYTSHVQRPLHITEPSTYVRKIMFVFTSTRLSRPPAPDDSVYFHRYISNIFLNSIYLLYFIFHILILVNKF